MAANQLGTTDAHVPLRRRSRHPTSQFPCCGGIAASVVTSPPVLSSTEDPIASPAVNRGC